MVSSSNHVQTIDTALVSRFGKPYEFQPLTNDQRRELFKCKLLGSLEDMETKTALARASDDEWGAVIDLLPQDTDLRYFSTDLIPKVKAQVFRERFDGERTASISLDDFKNYLRQLPGAVSTQSAQDKVVAWIQQNFDMNGSYQQYYGHENEQLVQLYEGLVVDKEIMPNDILLCLGANRNDLSNLRSKKCLWNKGCATDSIRTTLEECFAIALPDCEFWEMTGAMRVPIVRKRVCVGGVLHGYETEQREPTRAKGWMIRRLRFKPQWQPGSPQTQCIEWATLLGATPNETYLRWGKYESDSVVSALLKSYPTYSDTSISSLLHSVPNDLELKLPELVSVSDIVENRLESCGLDPRTEPHVKCTFKHPSGVLAEIWVSVWSMKKHYPDEASHL